MGHQLSIESLCGDVLAVLKTLYGDSPPAILLVGHSMGGSVAVHVAARKVLPNLAGLIVVDVVEGTAMASLMHMQKLLSNRMQYFPTIEKAIEWSVKGGTLRNIESARISIPSTVKYDDSKNELQELLDAIRSSEVVESRAQLITKLANLDVDEDIELDSLMEFLAILWEDFTCLDISQCTLNKTILHVAAKYLDSGISRCPHRFYAFGTKASKWVRKHLKMTLISTEESQEEEHSSIFFQLLLDLLKYSGDSFSALARCPVSTSKAVVIIIEEFISEQLSLAKECLSEIKKIDSKKCYVHRARLMETEQYWRGWYEGLSEKFLSSPVPKILLLAGTDRLDRALTIGQMQGKFQMVLVRHRDGTRNRLAPGLKFSYVLYENCSNSKM